MQQETEEIFLLRHRFGRTIEIWTAYNVFLKKQVFVGGDYVCYNTFVVEQTTHTLLISYYSYLHSLFDPSGTNFIQATEPFIEGLPERAKIVRKEIIEHWEKIQIPINKIRNNIGFHGGKKLKNQTSGYAAYADTNLHPWSPDYLLQLLRIFFRDLDSVVSLSENYLNHISSEETEKLYNLAKELKKEIDNNPIDEIFKDFIKHLNKTDQNENNSK